MTRVRLGALAALGLVLGAAVQARSPSPLVDVERVTVGSLHACAATAGGRIVCWGDNSTAQLGLGPAAGPAIRVTPVPVPELAGTLGLSSGYAHTCVVTSARGVSCWGLNASGQSGDASLEYTRASPGPVAGLGAPVVEVSTGESHSCALLEGGTVSCWGDDSQGQLGDGQAGDARGAALPVELGGPARAVAAGNQHTCAVRLDGRVLCWGRNDQGQLGDGSTTSRALPTPIQDPGVPMIGVALGSNSSCALGETGGVHCWGPQYPFQAFSGGSLVPRVYPGVEAGVQQLTAGTFHYCALLQGNRTRCFGENAFGQFGTGPIDGSLGVDSAVGLAPGVTQLDAGGSQTCARNAAGGLQCWGDNGFGQLGIGVISRRLVPTPVAGLDREIAMVGSGGYHGCALTTAGTVKCWGANPMVGDGTDRLRLTPVDVPGVAAGARALETGVRSNCVITAQRRARCWGANFAGQLGIGMAADSALPTDVVGLGAADVIALGVGRDHACALLAGGAVKCWGSNDFGQVGDGATERRLSAVDVAGLASGIRALSVGWLHSCVVTDAGAVKCWGYNADGQLGDGSSTQRSTPVDVVGLSSGVVGLGAGGVHSCALLADGSVRCWGDLSNGTALGDGSRPGRTVPGVVPGLAGVEAISASLFDTCVRLREGAMKCWGGNDGGDIGDNTTLTRPTPVDVPGLNRGVTHIDGSYGSGGHTCAVVDGAARCWGENIFAQIGDGTTHGVTTPQTVVTEEIVRRVDRLDGSANGGSSAARVDATGRYVVFQSAADNLVPGDSNGAVDVFRRDRESGAVMRISVDTAGGQIAGDSGFASVSADGQLVAFLAPADAVGPLLGESSTKRAARRKDGQFILLLRNLLTGTTQRVGPASVTAAAPAIAPGGGTIAFTATTTDPSEGAPGQANVYVVPLLRAGDAVTPGTSRCVTCKSTTPQGGDTASNTDAPSDQPALSADGRWLVHRSGGSNAIAGQPSPCPSGNGQILLRDLLSGAVQRISPPATLGSTDCGAAGSQQPSIDHAGDTVVWQTDQGLDAGDANGLDDAYAWRSSAPAPARLSIGGDGADTAGAAHSPQVSGDGKQVVFLSAASNHDLDAPDNNDRVDLHSVSLDDPTSLRRLSRTVDGGETNAASQSPALSFDGSQVVFHSAASNLLRSTSTPPGVFSRGNPLAPPRKSATWWIPGESGWGLTVFDQGNLLAPTWFTYDSDGEPTWFIVGGAFPQANGHFTGDVLRLTGVPFDRIDGNATLGATRAGSVDLEFQGEDRLRFAYTVDGVSQAKTLERFAFGQRGFTCSASPSVDRRSAGNYTDLWTGVGGGWGLTLFHVDQQVVAIWYTYDSDGEAVFFVVSTTRQADGSFAGQVFRQRNGTPFSAIDGASASPGADPIGTATLRFADGQNAVFSYVVGEVSQGRPITRLLVGEQGQVCRSTDAE